MKERFLQAGLSTFAPHEILELLLFFAVPQKDTNVLAHKLIDRFGSVRGVLSASYDELCTVDGVGDHVATLLRLCMPLAAYVRREEEKQKPKSYEAFEDVGEFFLSQFAGIGEEAVLLLMLDNSFGMIDCQRVGTGTINSVGVTPRRMIEMALAAQASMVVLAHNHPTGIAIPSQEDISATRALREAFSAVGVPLIEHILVANHTYRGLLGQMRSFKEEKKEENNAVGATFYSATGFLK
ncbi:MAG: DNA repair protein RadC [Clostridia bacterium]|nr:DNA repair protein RadC [Clostridia bacterium]